MLRIPGRGAGAAITDSEQSYLGCMGDGFDPAEGGVKIVFDVLGQDVHDIAPRVTSAGFTVRRYYQPEDEHRRGGSAPGHCRLGAERAMTEFSDGEIAAIVADFDLVQLRTGFMCLRVGTDSWTAGGNGSAGDREPRESLPKAGAGSAVAERSLAAAGEGR